MTAPLDVLRELRDAARDLDRAVCRVRSALPAEALAAVPELDRYALDRALGRVRRALKES